MNYFKVNQSQTCFLTWYDVMCLEPPKVGPRTAKSSLNLVSHIQATAGSHQLRYFFHVPARILNNATDSLNGLGKERRYLATFRRRVKQHIFRLNYLNTFKKFKYSNLNLYHMARI